MRLDRPIKKAIILSVAGVLAACASAPLTEYKAVQPVETVAVDRDQLINVGAQAVDDLLSRPTFIMYEVDDVKALHYAEAATLYGAAKFAGFRRLSVRTSQLG